MSNQQQQRIYVGNGKNKTVAGVQIVKLMIDLDKLNEAAAEHGFDTQGGRKISIDVWPRKDGPDNYGNAYSVQVDTFKPSRPPSHPGAGDAQQGNRPPPPEFPKEEPPQDEFAFNDDSVDDTPF